MRIIEAGEKDCLKAFLKSVGEKLPENLDAEREGSNIVPDSYELIIECKDETEQQTLL